ncbi:N-acyl-D-amino-acid deacylase [Natrialba hulunbeirensis JCM 10989]|uniref:N-acyl-D-amino-acid deacylase n=1 Tax=Natrialba hulunbeirensis JCM 10989 TaxID=1227493 RepID=M0A1V6_9EURY|nr:D-aminoacylase [Natrialba hulunbeirensis]ELY92306.1 N-acyl-D-amino-acid deacylase [Natrialba hulunbeirensis JCM 10989]
MADFDTVIRNGRLVDGTGSPWFNGDVAVRDGRIAAIGTVSGTGATELDADGHVVAPGFIDIHTHSDYTLPANRAAHSKVRQGVTLEIVGNCGTSAAPRHGLAAEDVDEGFAYRGVGDVVDTSQWETMAEYLDHLDDPEAGGVSLNVGSLVGHENVRIPVLGYEDREPTADELEEMKALLDEALSDGAVGLSTGLIYTPGAFAETEELVELAGVVAEHDKLYTTHMRSEGDDIFAALEEAIEIGDRAGVPVQVSHHKAVGRDNWGKVRYTLRRMERAREDGVEIQCEQYPYTASSTSLVARLPTWAREGGTEATLERLTDDETQAEIRRALESNTDSWDDILITNVRTAELEHVQGKTVGELAERVDESRTPAQIVVDLLIEDRCRPRHIHFSMSEQDVEEVMAHDLTMIGSDGNSLRPAGPLGKGVPHPRSYGTFPRVLGHYVREESVISLETAVYKMTGQPAARLGLEDRGVLKQGMWADITVFDPDTVSQGGSFVDPAVYPDGIPHVLVNGEFVVQDGEHTDARPGVALR